MKCDVDFQFLFVLLIGSENRVRLSDCNGYKISRLSMKTHLFKNLNLQFSLLQLLSTNKIKQIVFKVSKEQPKTCGDNFETYF